MTQRYRKDGLTKRGNIWYLQFRILDGMRRLPAFRNIPSTKTIFNQSLHTSDYLEAAKRADAIRIKMQLKEAPQEIKRLPEGADAYFAAVQRSAAMPKDELINAYRAFEEAAGDSVSPTGVYGNEVKIEDENTFNNAIENNDAIRREMKRRLEGKKFKEPLKYEVTLKYAAEKYVENMEAFGTNKKTQSKVTNAVKRYLEWWDEPDVALDDIEVRHVKQYILHAVREKRKKNTFSNDINYLGKTFNLGLEEGWIQNLGNPFKGRDLKGLIEKESYIEFTHEMLLKMKNDREIKEDHDLRQLFWISYFTGMRLSEVFTVKYKIIENVVCFDVASEGGKTKDAKRTVPVHSWLLKNLIKDAKDGDVARWESPSDTALGKRFGRFKTKALADLLPHGQEHLYAHHSFRHGFITTLLAKEAGSEVFIAKLTGHKMTNVGRTEAAKTYFGRVPIKDLARVVELFPPIE